MTSNNSSGPDPNHADVTHHGNPCNTNPARETPWFQSPAPLGHSPGDQGRLSFNLINPNNHI